jgi:hypothetical protein
MSCLLGDNKDIFFPKLSQDLHLITFAEIAVNYLNQLGYEPYICSSEEEARQFFQTNNQSPNSYHNYWPCYFTHSDTTGEKDFEEFFMEDEVLDLERFENLGIVKSSLSYQEDKLDWFLSEVNSFMGGRKWSKADLVDLFNELLPAFDHKETGKYLDAKM